MFCVNAFISDFSLTFCVQPTERVCPRHCFTIFLTEMCLTKKCEQNMTQSRVSRIQYTFCTCIYFWLFHSQNLERSAREWKICDPCVLVRHKPTYRWPYLSTITAVWPGCAKLPMHLYNSSLLEQVDQRISHLPLSHHDMNLNSSDYNILPLAVN